MRNLKTKELEITVYRNYVFDCEYTVDSKTGTVLIHRTPTGLKSGEGLTETEPIKIPVPTDGNTINGFTLWPVEVTGDKLNEASLTYVRRDDLWPDNP